MPPAPPTRRTALAAAASVLALGLAGCGDAEASAAPGPAGALRLGYLANVTHAPALVGVAHGFLAAQLGSTRLRTQVLNAGPAAIESLNAGAIDAAYLGPSPAINAFVRSAGDALRIVSGATSGGAQLVVRPGITTPAQLRGTDIATPQLGGTQDVALRAWLSRHGLRSTLRGRGDVHITPTQNALTLQLFQQGRLDGAWLPEPWCSRLVLDAGATVLVDERTLWPRGRFVTTHLVVSRRYLARHPQTVQALLRGHVASVDWIRANPAAAPPAVNAEIAVTGKPLSEAVMARAFANITVTLDPLAASLARDLADGVSAGVVEDADLHGIYDLRPLNAVLRAQGRSTVSAGGLGEQ